jgi:hypothetical protein
MVRRTAAARLQLAVVLLDERAGQRRVAGTQGLHLVAQRTAAAQPDAELALP